jgi:hypothetical protein
MYTLGENVTTLVKEGFPMVSFNHILAFMQILWERDEVARRAARIVHAILKAHSFHMRGSLAANYKAIQRFLAKVDPREVLWRLYQPQAPFMIGDVTEIPRPQARRTPYDGKTRGFWLLMLAHSFSEEELCLLLSCSFLKHHSSREQFSQPESLCCS